MNNKGQMAVELSFIFPVLIVVAVVMVNALSFAGECARFDREFRNCVRTQATTPELNAEPNITFEPLENESFSCSLEDLGEFKRYVGELQWSPTLFGMGLKSSVFGVALPSLSHECSLTVDEHRSGDLL